MPPRPVDRSQQTLKQSFKFAITPKGSAKPDPPKQKPANRITGIITNVWHQPSPNVSSTSHHVYVLEVGTPVGTSYLVSKMHRWILPLVT